MRGAAALVRYRVMAYVVGVLLAVLVLVGVPLEFLAGAPGVDQVLGTAVLMFLIFAITDPLGANPSPAVSAIAIGLVVVAIGMALGLNNGYAINPARDFGPRLMEFFTGYGTAWTDQHGNVFFWVPILGPIVGGLVGGAVYQLTVARALPRGLLK